MNAPESREIAARPSQSYIDAIGHYRNLAISLGAKPEQMLNTFDRDLCRNGLDFERGNYTVDDSCGDLAEVWDEVDRMADEIERLRSALADSGCGICDPTKRKTKLDHDLLHGYVHPTSVTR